MDRELSTEILIDYHFGTLAAAERVVVEDALMSSAEALRAYLQLKRQLDLSQPRPKPPRPRPRPGAPAGGGGGTGAAPPRAQAVGVAGPTGAPVPDAGGGGGGRPAGGRRRGLVAPGGRSGGAGAGRRRQRAPWWTSPGQAPRAWRCSDRGRHDDEQAVPTVPTIHLALTAVALLSSLGPGASRAEGPAGGGALSAEARAMLLADYYDDKLTGGALDLAAVQGMVTSLNGGKPDGPNALLDPRAWPS